MGDSSAQAGQQAVSVAGAAGKRAEAAVTSAWVPLRRKLFRALWIAAVASNLGTWMHEVGGNWLMTQLAPTPLMVSLIQTAEAVPVFFLALAAGALADVIDRRRLLIFSQAWMLAAATGLGVLTLLHLTTPQMLLAFTFLLSFGNALNGPAWQAIVPELVPRGEVPAAVSLNSVGFNVARAAGPALGGLIVAAAGSGAVFLLNAVSFLGVIVVLYEWRRPRRESVLPAERVASAMRAGLRYVIHAPPIHAVLMRTTLFMLGASALWGLVPLFARQNLGRGAAGYGVLLGFFGSAAVIGGSFLPRLQQELGVKRLLAAGALLYSGALALMALWHSFPAACVGMLAAGLAWTTQLSTFNTSVQLNAPAWVRGRAIAVYQLTYYAAMGACSAMWGTVALHVGIPRALLIAALVLAAGLMVAARFPVGLAEDLNLEPSSRPAPVVVNEPEAEHGPVMVTVEYWIKPEQAAEFARAMLQLGRVRRRDGAIQWGLYEDVGKPGRFVETFVVESWAEHLRQHDRATVADREIWELVRSFHQRAAPPAVSHLLYAYHEET
ncbi:MAG TPA: MFS transporter [Terriglobia bacterium]|jgi:MFS family permease|nr:MFS transporter [Terriglobia bacterium]